MYDEAKMKKKVLGLLHKMASVTKACKEAKISRALYYQWREKDEEFKKEAEEILNEEQVDFAEDCLKAAMQRGDTKAIIYYLNNRGKSRGWGEKQELAVDVTSGGQPLKYSDFMPKE